MDALMDVLEAEVDQSVENLTRVAREHIWAKPERAKEMNDTPVVVVIAGSTSDEGWVDAIVNELSNEGIEWVETQFASAHREPRRVLEMLDSYNKKKKVVFVTVAGKSNALSGVVAANTPHVVIACPPLKTEHEYLIDIHSSLRMPSGVPVLTVLGTKNCALAVARIVRSW